MEERKCPRTPAQTATSAAGAPDTSRAVPKTAASFCRRTSTAVSSPAVTRAAPFQGAKPGMRTSMAFSPGGRLPIANTPRSSVTDRIGGESISTAAPITGRPSGPRTTPRTDPAGPPSRSSTLTTSPGLALESLRFRLGMAVRPRRERVEASQRPELNAPPASAPRHDRAEPDVPCCDNQMSAPATGDPRARRRGLRRWRPGGSRA